MGFYSDVKPGESFRPSASLSNDVRHLLNRLNGFGGGVNPAAAPGIVRIPVYNSTSAVLSEGKAVSIDISGVIAGECYPAIAYSDTMPCYGVLAKDLNPAEVGDCILSGLAVVQISSTPATGNYATPGTGGVFVRGDEGVPIVNVSSTSAVVMLGAVKASGGGGQTYNAGDGILIHNDTIYSNLTAGIGIYLTGGTSYVDGGTTVEIKGSTINATNGSFPYLNYWTYVGGENLLPNQNEHWHALSNGWLFLQYGLRSRNHETVTFYLFLTDPDNGSAVFTLQIGETISELDWSLQENCSITIPIVQGQYFWLRRSIGLFNLTDSGEFHGRFHGLYEKIPVT